MKLRGKDKGKPLEAKASGSDFFCLIQDLSFQLPSIRWQEEVERFWANLTIVAMSSPCKLSFPVLTDMCDYFFL